ncbi:TadE/TadG family type IV pilus assembly protein [Phreatobacter sp.]|uniref:TadE/TadG family type IV pilus assembly protein n=1 Tax=Phreatobacter sp. TaxID=1966341 RepID=UPI0022CA7D95|nr:TadE/TadG family type IV pilus assembly protein [Phreatobacter sp.]MCZ8314900.1 pilus assembly protein [Phreatobacter sp.]
MIARSSNQPVPRRLTRLAHSARHALRRFRDDRSGAIAQLFAVALLPIIGIAGGAVDYTMASGRKVRLQSALDAATLAATRTVTANSTNAQITQIIRNYINANLDFGPQVVLTVTVDPSARKVDASATLNHAPYLLPVVGISSIPIGAQSASQLGRNLLEVALVLDNSGSMSGSRITTLRSSANDLMRKVLDMAYIPGDAKVAVVPFASMVNVGSNNANASWIDTQGFSPFHNENFAVNANRLNLYSQMRNVTWGGCVEARPSPHDVTDTPPTSGNPATLFVPSFAPDEPDEGSWSGFYNNYLSDGSCQSGLGTDMLSRQRRTCKYNGATPDTSLANGTRRGPNQLCDSNPIIPLTSNQTTLATAITAMPNYGGTNLHEAVMWGWRVLSPEPPFTEGRAYNDVNNRKFLVLMTDGANDAIGLPTMNGSFYSAYGFSAAGRLGTTSSNRTDIVAKMNEKTLTACANIKAQGILIYTVGFYVTDATARSILAQCASNASMALLADSDEALANAFDAIGDQIKRLRLTN